MEKILNRTNWGIVGKEYDDRQDRQLREEYDEPAESPVRVVVGPTPWSGGQAL